MLTPRSLLMIVALAGLPMACTSDPVPDHAFLQSAAPFGSNQDPGTAAVVTTAWTLAEPSRTRGNPAGAARAAAGVDYLAGDLYANPRWVWISPLLKQQMLDARVEVRRTLGINPAAPSQQVVDSLLGVASAVAAGDRATAEAALKSPVFTLPPDQTFALLANLPPTPEANVATQRLNNAFVGASDHSCNPFCS